MGAGAPKPEGWAGGPQLREREPLASDRPCPQTTPAQPRPLPGRGSLQAFFFFFFKLEKLCLVWVLGLFVTWQTGGRFRECAEHLEQFACFSTPPDLSLSKVGPWRGRGGCLVSLLLLSVGMVA